MKKLAAKNAEHQTPVTLGEIVLSVKTKPPAEKREYHTYEMDSQFGGFIMYCAGEGQAGGGQLVFDEQGVSVLLKPESAWRPATKAKRNEVQRISEPNFGYFWVGFSASNWAGVW